MANAPGKNNDPNWHLRDDQRNRDTAFPNTSAGDESATTFAARSIGVPEFAVGAMNRVINAAIPGFANGGYVGAGYAPPPPMPFVSNMHPSAARRAHEVSPGVPCPSCAAGVTYPIR
ncbi:hypothetical protein QEN35_20950 [Gordonia alkanivorans]|uniref:hypothetical protein n=1 Tax=Gordonia alkanivorans TaxID=84096 RepID=UPI001F4E6BD4|nr:hypothetical protein [Gordonia alkanivorans]MDH3026828.1 hypothetical protein [Gordonia alkanivorans]